MAKGFSSNAWRQKKCRNANVTSFMFNGTDNFIRQRWEEKTTGQKKNRCLLQEISVDEITKKTTLSQRKWEEKKTPFAVGRSQLTNYVYSRHTRYANKWCRQSQAHFQRARNNSTQRNMENKKRVAKCMDCDRARARTVRYLILVTMGFSSYLGTAAGECNCFFSPVRFYFS